MTRPGPVDGDQQSVPVLFGDRGIGGIGGIGGIDDRNMICGGIGASITGSRYDRQAFADIVTPRKSASEIRSRP